MDSGTYDAALFLHLLGALSFFAGIVVAGVAFEVARHRRQPAEVALMLGTTRIGVLLVLIGTLLLAGFGFWLVHLGRWGYGSAWVDVSIGLFVVALTLGGLGGQKPKQARRLAGALAERGEPLGEELRALLDDPLTRISNYLSLGLVLAIVGIMVFKP